MDLKIDELVRYLLLGKGHGFVPTDWPDEGVTKDIADAILSAM